MMKGSEGGTVQLKDPVFLIRSAKVTLAPCGESLMINSEIVDAVLGDQLNV